MNIYYAGFIVRTQLFVSLLCLSIGFFLSALIADVAQFFDRRQQGMHKSAPALDANVRKTATLVRF